MELEALFLCNGAADTAECGAVQGTSGAGGGGFLVFYVRPEDHRRVREAMKDLMYIPFEFENSGTQVIYYTPETYEPRVDE